MSKVGFVYDDAYLGHVTPQWHPESPERLRSVLSAVNGSGLDKKLVMLKPRSATKEELKAVHSAEYIEKIISFGTGYADPDTYISPGTLDAALKASGALIEALDRCKRGEINRAFCAVRPPGHHAESGRAMGFCIFNNVAVAARYAQKSGFAKIFIIDFDVHHGNGTQHIFEDDDSVYYFSTHQWPHYPGTGADSEKGKGAGKGFTRNITMPAGSGDEEYSSTYNDVLPGLMRDFSPDCVLVSAGYDIHVSDPLSQIRVTTDGIRSIVRGILSGADDKPAIFALEGGYDLKALSKSVVATLEELLA